MYRPKASAVANVKAEIPISMDGWYSGPHSGDHVYELILEALA